MPIQGTASELIKVAMISINRIMKEKGLKGKMILQIHDELLFEIPKYEKEEILGIIPAKLKTPLDIRDLIVRIVDDSEFTEFKTTLD